MDIRDVDIAHCREMLAPREARIAAREALTLVPLSDVEELNVEWGPFSTPRELPQFKEFLRYYTWPTNALSPTAGKRYVEGDDPDKVAFEIEGQPFFGRWRQAFVRERRQEIRRDEIEYFVQLTLRKGYVETFAWDEVLLDSAHTSPSNTSKVVFPTGGGASAGEDAGDTVSNSTSDTTIEALTLRIANCSPFKGQAIAKQISGKMTGTLTIEGVSYGAANTWHYLVADPARQQDGSVTVTFVIAKPQFTINGFESNNTTQERNIGYLWNVPETLGQSIIDSWDAGQGRSATASYSPAAGLLNIVLAAFAGKANLTTDWIGISCDTHERKHYAWGYTESELDTFLGLHDSAIGTTEDGKIIRSRQVQTQTRGDGLFDAIVTERSWAQAGENSTADFTITLPTGTKITDQQQFGYNFSLVNMDAIKSLYDTTVAAVGKTVNFRVTREDDCSFDYIASITTKTVNDSGQLSLQPVDDAGTASIDESLQGLGTIVQVLDSATLAEITSALAAYTPGVGKRLQMDLQPNDDQTFSGVLREVLAQTPTASETIAAGASTGLGNVVKSGHNATFEEMEAVIATFSSGIGKTHQIILGGGDDGGWDYTVREITEQAPATSESIGITDLGVVSSTGIPTTLAVGTNSTLLAMQTVLDGFTTGIGKRHQLIVDGSGDGGYSYRVVETREQSVSGSKEVVPVSYANSYGIGTIVASGVNRTLAQFQTVLDDFTSVARSRLDIRLNPSPDGGWSYVIIERKVQKVTASLVSGTTKQVLTKRVGLNADVADIDLSSGPVAGTTRRVNGYRPKDDGTVDFDVDDVVSGTREATTTATSRIGDVGISVVVVRKEDQAELPSAGESTAGVRVEHRDVRQDINERYSWTEITTTITAPAAATVIESVNLTEHRKTTIFSRWGGTVYYYVLLSQDRNVTKSVSRAWYLTRQSAAGAGTNERIVLTEVMGGLLYVLDTESIVYGDWSVGTTAVYTTS